jgi:ethanolamine utilization protein EutL
MNRVALKPRILSCQQIDRVSAELASSLGMDPDKHTSVGLVTCDQDDSLYVALDHATKFAEVDVVYAKSFYEGADHASGPLSGEILGVLAGPNPDEVAEGLWSLRQALERDVCFYRFGGHDDGPAFFPHVITEVGRYLAPQANIAPGSAMAYLIAPPIESVVAVDAALKEASVELKQWFGPPTETNFGGAFLSGELHDVQSAAAAFEDALWRVVSSPMSGMHRPDRERN